MVVLLTGLGILNLQRQKELAKQIRERKMYIQLYHEAPCRDRCKTIGPHEKAPKEDEAPCAYADQRAGASTETLMLASLGSSGTGSLQSGVRALRIALSSLC